MKTRNIETIIAPAAPYFVGDGFKVHHFIPDGQLSMKRMDPFIMLDYNSKMHVSPDTATRGVGPHPHRGFETVTIAYKGSVAHHDSHGGGGIIHEGDVQWMTAASGVLHKEYYEENFSRQGGDFQMVQLWINLPAKDKMFKPKYQSLAHTTMGHYILPGGQGIIEVIAGQYKNVKGPADTFTSLHVINARLNHGGKADFGFPSHYNTALLVIEGGIRVNGKHAVPSDHFALFKNDGESFEMEALQNSVVLVLSGEPVHEPIAAHGPFVMNTHAEIIQAFEDYNVGKFGYLED